MIIDAHHHAVPMSVYKKYHDPALPPKKMFFKDTMFTFSPSLCKLEDTLRYMDEAGVDMALLSVAQFANVMGREVCREVNEGMANEVARHPGRFLATAVFPQDDPKAAVEEIEYAVKVLKFPAVSMLTSLTPEITINSKDYTFPIYAKIQELGVPVFFHPNIKPFGSETECTISASVARGVDSAKTCLRLIYDVLPAFPDIQFVLPHFGGATLALKGRMQAFYEPPESLGLPPVREQYRNLAKTPLESEELGHTKAFNDMFDKLYIDGAGSGGWPPITEMAFRTVRHDHLLWGTDYPYEIHEPRDMRYYIDSVQNMVIPEASKKGFLGENLARLLRMEI